MRCIAEWWHARSWQNTVQREQEITVKIAVIGSGIAGLSTAYILHKHHDIVLYEADDRLGGHTATVAVSVAGRHHHIDTGFIVYNDWTYPNFIRLLNEVGVKSRQSDMSFSVSCEQTGLEFAGLDGHLALINGLFAQRKNLLSPSYLKMLLDIVRFNKQATADVENDRVPADINLTGYLRKHALGNKFRDFYLLPMGSAIWSTSLREMAEFPMRFMLPFMYRHGLLNVNSRPKWRTIVGGSHAYIDPLTAGFRESLRLGAAVTSVARTPDSVLLGTTETEEKFDQIVFACHSDQAVKLLADITAAERGILGAIRYQENEVVLHTDVRQLPANKRAWASWNYRLGADRNALPRLTYDMNRLMGIQADERFCVTLNNTAALDPALILQKFSYAHPVFNLAAADAQRRWEEINGVNRTWFSGAYWGKGFHEDAVNSAIRVAEGLGVKW